MLSLIDLSKAGRVGVSLTLYLFPIGNRKCAGHCNTIVRRLGKIGQLVVVDATTQMVCLHAGGAAKPTIPARLHALGYSAGGSVSGLSAAVAGARSLICSAVGRLT